MLGAFNPKPNPRLEIALALTPAPAFAVRELLGIELLSAGYAPVVGLGLVVVLGRGVALGLELEFEL